MFSVNAKLDQLAINALRCLAIDLVQAANSGHPGAPLGMAPAAYTLWDRFLRHNPRDPHWVNRDRFVLSAGHASALLYALLHLTGYDLSLDELRNFRQWGSKTPGHPERGLTPGVEATTGPLGQGFANAVGMAVAEKWLAARFNHPGHDIVDHFTYVMVSDGDLEEGVSYEAASLAGRWGLGKLICLYDCNGIQIEGSTHTNFPDDIGRRFQSMNWDVHGPVDGENVAAIADAIVAARGVAEHPSIVIVKSSIGYGSPLADCPACHGAPLGAENVAKTKEKLGQPATAAFFTPEEAAAHLRGAVERGAKEQARWQTRLDYYGKVFPDMAKRLLAQLRGELPAGWEAALSGGDGDGKPVATRVASGRALNALAKKIDFLIGGSADLAPSNNTEIKNEDFFADDKPWGRNIHFGVREHAMGAIANGLALHGGVVPYVGTFLTFADYMREPIRLAAMSGLRVIYVFTHDSIGLGEDGPTHQPIEQLLSLRAIPGLCVIRPADAGETAVAWRTALARENGPTALILTRQATPALDRRKLASAEQAARGGYVLWQSGEGRPDLILLASGSELAPALAAGERLAAEANVRVVSLPSWDLFDAQPADYRESVLPEAVRARVAVEAGRSLGWERYVGLDGAVAGIDRFGASAPAARLFEEFHVGAAQAAALGADLLKRRARKRAAAPRPPAQLDAAAGKPAGEG
jgi:transketolase